MDDVNRVSEVFEKMVNDLYVGKDGEVDWLRCSFDLFTEVVRLSNENTALKFSLEKYRSIK